MNMPSISSAGIDPELGRCGAAPTVVSNTAWSAGGRKIHKHAHPKTKAITGFDIIADRDGNQMGRQVIGAHQFDRLGSQQAVAVEDAAVEKHLAEAQVVAQG